VCGAQDDHGPAGLEERLEHRQERLQARPVDIEHPGDAGRVADDAIAPERAAEQHEGSDLAER
jgi:hypothetical protein